ncbi:MAG TPA: molybdenum cofactor guanylyltransferase [Verrucomicrobiae bacterium]|jgi:molybdopterin-guanine dinucleotide biosynthesis protein A
MKTLTAVLFAGGESRRMGADKATLAINGEPLWSRQLRILQALQPEKILVSARRRPVWCPPEIEVVPDKIPRLGPLGGLQAGLGRAETTHLLALAVDLPLMTAGCLAKIFAHARPGCGAVVKADFYEPLCAVYPVSDAVRALVAEYASSPMHSLQPLVACLVEKKWMRALPACDFDPRLFANVNTPDELGNLNR